MPKDLVIGGVVMRTAQDVLDNYTPESERVPSEVWHTVRPLAVRAVSKSTYRAPTSVHFALRITARFLAWALEQDLPLDPEVMFTPQRVEQYIAEGEGTSSPHSQDNYRAALTNVGRAITKRAPWEPDRTQYTKHVRLAPPYTDTEMAGYWDAVEQQSEKGAHILRSLSVLAHGGGLKVPELMDITAHDIYFLAGAPVASIKVADRLAPVLTQYTEGLRALCAARPEGPIIGTQKRKSNDTFANFRKAIKTPPISRRSRPADCAPPGSRTCWTTGHPWPRCRQQPEPLAPRPWRPSFLSPSVGGPTTSGYHRLGSTFAVLTRKHYDDPAGGPRRHARRALASSVRS